MIYELLDARPLVDEKDPCHSDIWELRIRIRSIEARTIKILDQLKELNDLLKKHEEREGLCESSNGLSSLR